MSSLHNHPDDGVMLRYLDGEVPVQESDRIKSHLEACGQCRVAMEELEASIADCAQYRNVLREQFPAAPAEWPDLNEGFARIDAEVGVEMWTARLRRVLLAPLAAPAALRWAVSAAAAMLLAAGLYYQFHETPSVQAATLLKRAAAAAETHPAPARAIKVRTRNRQFVMHAKAEAPEILALFETAHYNFENPLSARSYQGWRDSVATKHDEVTTDANYYRIQTTTEEGTLTSASLMLRSTDLHPVEGRFEFRNQEWVELTEFAEASTTDGPTNTVSRLEAPVRRAEPSRSAAVPPGSSALISEELRVLAALHGIGADLGDPIEIKRGEDRVLVSGTGLAPLRRQEIRQALSSLPNVSVQFTEPPATNAAEQPADKPAEPVAPKPATLQARLEKQLGGRVEFERFSSQMLDWTEAAMAHAYALRALAQRFPAETEAAMPPADRTLLNDLAREHTRFLITKINDLRRTLAPVLSSLGGSTAQGRFASSQAWQPVAEEVFQASRRAELLLSELMGVTSEPADAAQLPSDLLTSLDTARAGLEQLQREIQ